MAITQETRPHVVGDLVMVSGTFTAGGEEIDYSSYLKSVIAAGCNLNTVVTTGVLIDNGSGEAVGQTALTVDTVDARLALYIGQTIYKTDGTRVGLLTGVAATELTVGAGTVAAYADNDPVCVMGTYTPSVTMVGSGGDIAIDATNNVLIINARVPDAGVGGSISTVGGTWWAIGQRA